MKINEATAVRLIETVLKLARGDGCSPCRVLTQVCANHLFSDESDECHIDGKEFGAQIDEAGFESLKE